MEKNCDVFILGAGLSGGTLALQLKKQNPDLEIVVCDRKSFPLVVGSGSVGESTVEVASHYLANVVGLKEHLEISQLPKLGLRYFLETKGDLITDRLEIGTNKFSVTPSYQLDRSLLENFIWNKLVANKIETFANSEIVECQ